ncbi:hypothetical protein ACNOYE_00365 [Nannocystaceae bacterium ST9]
MLRGVTISSLAFALLGCRVAASSSAHPSEASEPAPAVVDEAEPSESPTLPVAFGYVTPGGERDTGLPQLVDKGGLAWVAGALGFESLDPALAEALARVGIRDDGEVSSSDAIDPRVLVDAGFGPPSPTIWLVDDEGACEATIAGPHVATYFDVGPTLEVSWRLEGCDPSRWWAPIGLFTVAPPERLRYVEGETSMEAAVELASFAGRSAPLLREFAEGYDELPDELWVRERTIPGTAIAQIQLAGLWRDHPAKGEDYDSCAESADVIASTGRFREAGFEPYAMGLDDQDWLGVPELVGAFVIEGEANWLVFAARMQALVITPGGPPQEILTGIHHDEVVAFTDWSPAASCEP